MKRAICLLITLVLCIAAGAGIAETAETVDVFGTLDGARYENSYMGLGCVFEGWKYNSQEEILARYNLAKEMGSEEYARIMEQNTSLSVMLVEAPDSMQNTNLVLDSLAGMYVKVNGEDSYFSALQDTYAQLAPGQGWENFVSEKIERQIGSKTVKGLKLEYTFNGIPVHQLQVAYLQGNYMGIVTVSTYFTDSCDSVLEHYYLLGE